jgi:hypothetical protein
MKREILLSAVALGLVGCATLQGGDARATERALVSAGFQVKRADTPEKLAHLQTLPARKILRGQHAGQPYYVYADPKGCTCLYAGTEPQYQKYRELVREETAAAEAKLVTDDASDFRLWGPGALP